MYAASGLQIVTPVINGASLASSCWPQAMIRDRRARRMIFDLDGAIPRPVERFERDGRGTDKLTGIYHNLIRY